MQRYRIIVYLYAMKTKINTMKHLSLLLIALGRVLYDGLDEEYCLS